jgi:hypothetical protein
MSGLRQARRTRGSLPVAHSSEARSSTISSWKAGACEGAYSNHVKSCNRSARSVADQLLAVSEKVGAAWLRALSWVTHGAPDSSSSSSRATALDPEHTLAAGRGAGQDVAAV